jgi:hypothetical protein
MIVVNNPEKRHRRIMNSLSPVSFKPGRMIFADMKKKNGRRRDARGKIISPENELWSGAQERLPTGGRHLGVAAFPLLQGGALKGHLPVKGSNEG